jgi:hypothetical protein
MLAIQKLRPGQRIRLKLDNAIAEVAENPGDGTWLVIRRVASSTEEELCHINDILEIIP